MGSMPRRDSNRLKERQQAYISTPRCARVADSCSKALTNVLFPQVSSCLLHEYRVCDFGIGRDIIRLWCRIWARPVVPLINSLGIRSEISGSLDRQNDKNNLLNGVTILGVNGLLVAVCSSTLLAPMSFNHAVVSQGLLLPPFILHLSED